jgi:GST-like protein
MSEARQTETASPYVLIGRNGWGSAIVEIQLAHYGLPYELHDCGDLLDSESDRAALRLLNPLAQVPTLVLPGGPVLTESAAITLHLADVTGRDDFVPRAGSPERPAFLRWLVYLVANVYPTFTYADVPTRFVADEDAAEAFAEATHTYARKLWTVMEGEAQGHFFLGQRFSALDVYLLVMTRWRPGLEWFGENAPHLHSNATQARAQLGRWATSNTLLADVLSENFPPLEDEASGEQSAADVDADAPNV